MTCPIRNCRFRNLLKHHCAPDSRPSTHCLRRPGVPAFTSARNFVPPTAAPGVLSVAPWPAALHDSLHSGAATVSGRRTSRIKWRRTLEGPITTRPRRGSGRHHLRSLERRSSACTGSGDGVDKWTYDSGHTGGGDLSVSPLILPDGTIVWPTPGPQPLAFSPRHVAVVTGSTGQPDIARKCRRQKTRRRRLLRSGHGRRRHRRFSFAGVDRPGGCHLLRIGGHRRQRPVVHHGRLGPGGNR